jgi:hemoglobin/transferrin/lactoferrin receptor protein
MRIIKATLTMALGFLFPCAQAQIDTTANFSLDSTVITASRQEALLSQIPVSVSVLSEAQLQQQLPRSLPEALMQTPGVWMQKTNHGGGSPFVRGLTGNQTLLLIDGIRLNNSTYRYGPNQYLNTVDPFSLSKVEVLRGSGAVQYGSDALGGVVQLLTHNPEFNSEKTRLSAGITGKWMSADMEQTLRTQIRLASPKVAVHAGMSLKDFGDLLAGGDLGVQTPSAYQEQDGDFKARIRFSERQELVLAWQMVRQQNVGRYDQVAQRGYRHYEFDPQERSLAYARLKWDFDSNWFNRVHFTVSTQRSLEGRFKQKEQADFFSYEEDQVDTRGISLEVFSQPTSRWSAVSGVEYYADQIGSFAQRTSLPDSILGPRIRGLYPDGAAADNLGLFSLHRWQCERLHVEGGLRYNIFRLESFDPEFGLQNIQPQALVGNLGLSYLLGPKSRLFVSGNTGFRAPNINDLGSFGSFDSGIEVPVSSLDPERSVSLEAGYRWVGEKVRFSVSAYHSWLIDLISRVRSQYQGQDSLNGEQVYTKANVNQASIQGVEAEGRWQLSKGLVLQTYLIYTFGENAENGEPLRRIPPFYGNMMLRYKRGPWFANLQYQFAGTQNRLSGGDIDDHRIPDGGTPGWQIFNAWMGYDRDWLRVSLGLQNLTDEAYRMHGSGVDGYGRSVWVAAGFWFN